MKIEKTDFQQKLNEKLQAASERQLEKMAPAKPTVTEKKKPGRKAKKINLPTKKSANCTSKNARNTAKRKRKKRPSPILQR